MDLKITRVDNSFDNYFYFKNLIFITENLNSSKTLKI